MEETEEQRRQRKLEKKLAKRERREVEERQRGAEQASEAKGGAEESAKKKRSSDDAEKKDAKRVKEDTVKVSSTADANLNLTTFELARKAFPKVSHKMFDSVTSNFKEPTPIQAQTWGATLAGRDVIGIAQTGSGKTLAFTLPVVARIMDMGVSKRKNARPVALVLAPTRELCTQSYVVAQEACAFGGLNAEQAYGGSSRTKQLKLLRNGVDFLVATPGRLKDFLESGDVSLDDCSFAILDEADRMLDMGFEKDVRKILALMPEKTRQTLMFSATWPDNIKAIASEFLRPDAVRMTIGGEKLKANTRIDQKVEVMDPFAKERRLIEVLEQNRDIRTIVFALYKKEAERVQQTLQRKGFRVAGVHGDKSQSEREAAVASFAKGDCSILVATDVASRGLDIKGVELVINFTFPLTIEDYVHRIGRTGRAGASGRSITFFTEHDKSRAGELQNILREAGVEVPEALAKFGSTVKKKEHALYGAHFKADADLAGKTATLVTFDSDDE